MPTATGKQNLSETVAVCFEAAKTKESTKLKWPVKGEKYICSATGSKVYIPVLSILIFVDIRNHANLKLMVTCIKIYRTLYYSKLRL